MNGLSFNQKRLVVGIAALAPLFCLVNTLLSLGAFGRFDHKALIASFVFIAVVSHFFGPSVQEIREYRDAKRRTRNG